MSLRQLTIGVLLAGVACVAGIASFALTPDKPTAPKPNAKVTPTFSKHIAPILYKNCSTCHRSGEVAPFSLMNYQDAKKRAKQIALVTQSGFMPPWKADANYGEHEGVRVLTAEQKDLLQRWSEAGAPEGVSSQTPQPPKFSSDWALGTPDSLVEPS